MAKEIAPVDISTNLELVRLIEEVACTGKARMLRRADQDVAILMPLTTRGRTRKVRAKTEADYEAFRASAGSWEDVDTDRLVEELYENRQQSSRPPVEL